MKNEITAVINARKEFFIQEARIELNNAMDFLKLHCDDWKREHGETYRELLCRSEAFIAKADAMDEIDDALPRYPLIVSSRSKKWNELTQKQKDMAERQYRYIRSIEEEIPEEDVDIAMLPECRWFDVIRYDNGDETVDADI